MNDAVASVLDNADQLMVNVVTRSGPHVTPELFAFDNGRIWCLTAASTLKAQLLASGGRVGVAARAGPRAVVLAGEAIVLDPAHPVRSAAQLVDETQNHGFKTLTGAARGLARFALENAAELSGAAIAALTGRLGRPLPAHRVVIAIEPDATAVMDESGEVRAAGWNRGPDVHRPNATDHGVDVDDLLDDVPEHLRGLALDGPAFLGWITRDGSPLVLPSMWHLDSQQASVSAALLKSVGAAPKSRAAVTRDDWTGFGPLGKQGLMLRGDGSVRTKSQERAVDVKVDGVTYWDGIETGRSTAH